MKDLKIFAKTIDENAKKQIDLLLDQDAFKDCKVRIMPDVHAGAGCVIGFTANLGDKVIPNIVGVDIGCGMLTVSLGKIDIDYEKLDSVIREHIPSGMKVHDYWEVDELINGLDCFDSLRNIEHLYASMGTLGGGNHFIEIDEDDEGGKYLIIHTGSRNLGKQVAEIYQDIAVKKLHSTKNIRVALISRLKREGREKEISEELKKIKSKCKIPKDLCYLEGEDRQNYLSDMFDCQIWAKLNRQTIAAVICHFMEFEIIGVFETIHNYIDAFNMVRKGAISAHKNQKVLIPMNMRDGCIIGVGLGNEDWNCSAPHGAGRIMSRKQAKEKISLSEYQNSMTGIYTTSATAETIDEAPQAYKPSDEIIELISETIKIEKIIKPVYNFKASE